MSTKCSISSSEVFDADNIRSYSIEGSMVAICNSPNTSSCCLTPRQDTGDMTDVVFKEDYDKEEDRQSNLRADNRTPIENISSSISHVQYTHKDAKTITTSNSSNRSRHNPYASCISSSVSCSLSKKATLPRLSTISGDTYCRDSGDSPGEIPNKTPPKNKKRLLASCDSYRQSSCQNPPQPHTNHILTSAECRPMTNVQTAYSTGLDSTAVYGDCVLHKSLSHSNRTSCDNEPGSRYLGCRGQQLERPSHYIPKEYTSYCATAGAPRHHSNPPHQQYFRYSNTADYRSSNKGHIRRSVEPRLLKTERLSLSQRPHVLDYQSSHSCGSMIDIYQPEWLNSNNSNIRSFPCNNENSRSHDQVLFSPNIMQRSDGEYPNDGPPNGSHHSQYHFRCVSHPHHHMPSTKGPSDSMTSLMSSSFNSSGTNKISDNNSRHKQHIVDNYTRVDTDMGSSLGDSFTGNFNSLCVNDEDCPLINDANHQLQFTHTCRLFPCYHTHLRRHARLFRHTIGQGCTLGDSPCRLQASINVACSVQSHDSGSVSRCASSINDTDKAKYRKSTLESVNFCHISPDAPNSKKIQIVCNKLAFTCGQWDNVKVHSFKRYLHQVFDVDPKYQRLYKCVISPALPGVAGSSDGLGDTISDLHKRPRIRLLPIDDDFALVSSYGVDTGDTLRLIVDGDSSDYDEEEIDDFICMTAATSDKGYIGNTESKSSSKELNDNCQSKMQIKESDAIMGTVCNMGMKRVASEDSITEEVVSMGAGVPAAIKSTSIKRGIISDKKQALRKAVERCL